MTSPELTIKEISKGTVTLQWLDTKADYYFIEYSTTLDFWPSDLHPEEQAKRQAQMQKTTELEMTFNNLTDCSIYFFRCRGFLNDGTFSAFSGTLIADFSDNAPRSLAVLAQTSNSVSLSWAAPEGVSETLNVFYLIEYSSSDQYWLSDDSTLSSTQRNKNIVRASKTTAQVYVDLPVGAPVYIRIRAVVNSEVSDWSEIITTELTPATPKQLSIVGQSDTELNFKWDGTDFNKSKGEYQLTWSESKDYFLIDDNTLSSEDSLSQTIITKLPKGSVPIDKDVKDYYIKVRTVFNGKASAWSDIYYATTRRLIGADCESIGADCKTSRYDCDDIFDRVVVVPKIVRGTRVEWRLKSSFTESGPYKFSLELGYAGVTDDAAWRVVATGTDIQSLVDLKQRVWGQDQFTHYRVRLETPENIYYSKPLDCMGYLSYDNWVKAQGILDAEYARLVKGTEGIPGWLLKRKVMGPRCTRCLSYQTQEAGNSRCPVCYGTRFVGGYYQPVPCYYVNLGLYSREITVEDAALRGTQSPKTVKGRAIAEPMVNSFDIWVNARSDDRYVVHKVEVLAAVQDVPLILSLELRHINYQDQIYSFPVPSL